MADDDLLTVSTDEVRGELTERGQLEFELAMAKALNKKLLRVVEELRAAAGGSDD